MDSIKTKQDFERLIKIRTRLLGEYPFFGRLLLHLQFGFAECETAFTDMKRIVFDPTFLNELTDDEVCFVLLHEVMHCVLKHCSRGKALRPLLYNIACDIVVNSCILEIYHVNKFTINKSIVEHIAPNGEEGRLYSAEDVYNMLLNMSDDEIIEIYGESGFDNHIIWDRIVNNCIEDIWDSYIKKSLDCGGDGTGIPNELQRYLTQIRHSPKTNWRQMLQDFIRNDRSDFSYSVPDRRYQDDIILPSFLENVYGSKIDNLWLLIDTSGSVSNDEVTVAYSEICSAIEQIDSLNGKLSFFDTLVSTPVDFSCISDLMNIKPIGGGGTSFAAIFKYLKENMSENLPCAIIIMTDGYCTFPKEECALGVPVLWAIINSNVNPPWGEKIYIE